jgi:hypothetical protein
VEPITAELIAQQSYLVVTEDDFAKAAGVKKVMVEWWCEWWCGDRSGKWAFLIRLP